LARVKPVITLVGLEQAREGYTFIHRGPSPGCEGCEYYRVCIRSLEAGRVYTVVKPRGNPLPCRFHEGGVRAVEVVESGVWTAIPSKLAIEGSVTVFRGQECDVSSCRNREVCAPMGLRDGDRCTILEIGETVECPRGSRLVKVHLRRATP